MSKVTKVLFRVIPALLIATVLAACASSERHMSSAEGYDGNKHDGYAAQVDDSEAPGAKYPVIRMRQQ